MLAALFLACGIDRPLAQSTSNDPENAQLNYADQGWSTADRDVFYLTSQGSRMMPFDWYKALRRLDVDEPFGSATGIFPTNDPPATSLFAKNVGYATDQSPFKSGNFVTDPTNANGGHDFGTRLSEDDRWALIEYLKTL
jgi:hypothetical protein